MARWNRWWIALPFAALLAASGAWVVSAPRPAFPESQAGALEHGGDAGRGRLVFAAGDCASCHARPGQPDRLRLGGGLALGSPFGTFYPPNISPDPEDGIGRWRTIDLANALMSGVSPEGRHYYPALPFVSYARMRVQDVQDLMAYLRTLPPVHGRAPPHDLPFPLTIRRLVGFWKLFFMRGRPILDEPARDRLWNRGHYLSEALAHCAQCHSARNALGGIRRGSRFAGGEDQEGTGYVPNITVARLGHWSTQDFADTLTTGISPDLRRLGSSMAEVVTNLRELPASDRLAIATYVMSLPPRRSPDAVRQR